MSRRGGASGRRKSNLVHSSRNPKGRGDKGASTSNMQQPIQPNQQTSGVQCPSQLVQQPTQPIQQPSQPVQQHTQVVQQPSQPAQQPMQYTQQQEQQNYGTPSAGCDLSTPSSAGIMIVQFILSYYLSKFNSFLQ